MKVERERCLQCGSKETKIRLVEGCGWQITCTKCDNGMSNYYTCERTCEQGWNERQRVECGYIECEGDVWME